MLSKQILEYLLAVIVKAMDRASTPEESKMLDDAFVAVAWAIVDQERAIVDQERMYIDD